MNTIKVSPDLMMHYAHMTLNEVTLHMGIRAMATDGKLLRNIYRMSQVLGKRRYRLYDAEFKLKQRQLLYVHYTRNGTRDVPYWYVYDRPVGKEPREAIVKTSDVIFDDPNKSIWRKLRDAIVGTELDNFDLIEERDS